MVENLKYPEKLPKPRLFAVVENRPSGKRIVGTALICDAREADEEEEPKVFFEYHCPI